jgi:hypothetical protein
MYREPSSRLRLPSFDGYPTKGTRMAGKDKGPPNYRDSKSGEFVKPGYAKTHPATTQKEHNRPPPAPKKK